MSNSATLYFPRAGRPYHGEDGAGDGRGSEVMEVSRLPEDLQSQD